jgi:transcription elongation factor Elf1
MKISEKENIALKRSKQSGIQKMKRYINIDVWHGFKRKEGRTKLQRTIKECLNCGSKPRVGRTNILGLSLYAMVCKTCGARLPLYSKSVNDAKKAWNKDINNTIPGKYPAHAFGSIEITSMY